MVVYIPLNCVSIVLITLTLAFIYTKWIFTHWSRSKVPTLSPIFPLGDFKNFLRQHNAESIREFYQKFKAKGCRYGGVYASLIPIFLPIDLDLIKNILTTDFHYFPNHGSYIDESNDPLSGHLFNLRDDKWKTVRAKLTPTFTSGKLKIMFETLMKAADGMEKLLNEDPLNGESVEMKDICARFTTDVISSCAFGIEAKSLENPDSPMRYYGKQIFPTTKFEAFKKFAEFVIPTPVLKLIRYKVTKPDVSDFFIGVIENNIQCREREGIHRKDFLHLLIQLKNLGAVSDDAKILDEGGRTSGNFTVEEIAAQCYAFFSAGHETSSNTMTFVLYELCLNAEVQDVVRSEISEVLAKHGGVLTYDVVKEMRYLEQVIQETLRKYPQAPVLPRLCSEDYNLPGTSVVLKKGTIVFIPVYGLHRDPDYFPDPEKFDPDRFSPTNKAKIPNYAWLPFGEGPRLCIGWRFGMMQMKIGLISILKEHRVGLDENKTLYPLQYDPATMTLNMRGGLWVHLEKN